MKHTRLFAVGLAMPVLALMSLATEASNGPGRMLADSELSQVHAAGLPDPALQHTAFGSAEGAPAQALWQDTTANLDRQQALAQYKLAAAASQGAVGLVQSATLTTLFTPLAPLFIPTLTLPFPFLMLPPPKKAEPGH
ncbi:hypothetical protein [Piscinibacter sp.]|jgi:hypothetical protein|uniref:hypothetical protein n=1 Tax=Piscinibacter sp. TaxID=1903157 RepID=UPI00355A068F